ncbi:MAG TPA: tetratricopeptide repeat protein [Kofleriaceae bacterium]|nr:tetratricopeptide repeat protein [Kofleriaceae bacterium]
MAQPDFVSRGQDLVLGGQYQEAVKVCRLGLLARPTDVSGRLVLGQALLALRRYDEVLAEMRVAVELDARNGGAHQLKGEALLRKGDAFAAVDALERAHELAPGDPAIASLLAEARLAIAADGARTTGPAVGDYGDSLTKHYPAHRGGDAAGTGASGSLTRPISGAALRSGRTPPPEELAIGDRSGTVELADVDLEEDDDDDVAEPPVSAAAGGKKGTNTSPIGEDDMLDVEEESTGDVFGQKPTMDLFTRRPVKKSSQKGPVAVWGSDESSEGDTQAKPRMPQPSPRLPVPAPPTTGEQPTVPKPILPAAPPHPPKPNAMELLFPEDEPVRPNPQLAAMAPGPLADAAPSRAPAGLPSMPPGATGTPPGAVPRAAPQAQTMVPMNVAAMRPTASMPAAPPPPPEPTPAQRADLALIRAGLTDPTGVPVPPPGAPMPMPPPPRPPGWNIRPETELVRPGSAPLPQLRGRRPWMIAVWALITVVIIGGGVFAGFWIRELRLDKRISEARELARGDARADTWTGWRSARDRFAGVNRVRPDAGHRAALARSQAQLAADYHDDVEGARAAVKALGEQTGKDAALARAWLAIVDGDPSEARTAATAAGPADDADVSLVMARAALVEARWDDAAASAKVAAEQDPRPSAWLALCEAEMARKLWAEAEKACAKVDELASKELGRAVTHPGATIARARVRARSGAARQDTAKLVAELEALVTESGKPAAEQPLGVSPAQAAWAQLALAEVQLAVGDSIAVRRALERAQGARIDSRPFLEAEAAALLALGDIAAARAAAERGLTRWSASAPLTIVAARARLAAGDVAGAGAVLGGLTGAATSTMDALVARAALAHALGDLDGAERDLDAALARSADFEEAIVARAEIDLERGDARAALARIEPRYGPQASAPVAIVFASAKRVTRQFDAARAALTKFKDGPAGPLAGMAWLELARVERDAGELTAARAAYGQAAGMLPSSRAVRLESAVLLVDDGDAAGGRDALVRLATDAKDDGAVQVEVARAQTLTGELDAAKASLDLAEQAGAARSRVARERGRLALRKRDVAAAVSGLEAAAKGAPDDLEIRLLLMDAYVIGGNTTGAQTVADELTRLFPGRPETHLARGRLELSGGRPAEAQKQFLKARDLLAKAPRRQRADAGYWLALAAYIGDDLAKAKSLLLETTTTDPYHADAWSTFATVLAELGDYGGAAQAAEKTIKLDPDNVDAYFVLGEALALTRRTKEAKKPLEEYLRRAGPDGERVEDARALLKRK